jgi:hypothetical protein
MEELVHLLIDTFKDFSNQLNEGEG